MYLAFYFYSKSFFVIVVVNLGVVLNGGVTNADKKLHYLQEHVGEKGKQTICRIIVIAVQQLR